MTDWMRQAIDADVRGNTFEIHHLSTREILTFNTDDNDQFFL